MKKEMTLAEAGKLLRNLAEMTANGSENWDNFEAICVDMLHQAAKQVRGKE